MATNEPYQPPEGANYPSYDPDPLKVNQGFPLTDHGWNDPADFIAPVTIPYQYPYPPSSGVDFHTEKSPVTPGLQKIDGPTHWLVYPGLPGFVARLDIASGLRTEFYTGNVYSPFDYMYYTLNVTRNRLTYLCQNRDITSDILNLPGIKPDFRENWGYGYIRPLRPPNPRVDF